MNKNKFLLQFPKEPTIFMPHIHSHEWVSDRLELELVMEKWCLERIGPETFPYWQFSKNYVQVLDPSSAARTIDIMMSDGIFIFREEDRVAFKLTFGIA